MKKNMSLELLRFLWTSGSYSLNDMIDLVAEGQITDEEFFDITRYNYKGVTELKMREGE